MAPLPFATHVVTVMGHHDVLDSSGVAHDKKMCGPQHAHVNVVAIEPSYLVDQHRDRTSKAAPRELPNDTQLLSYVTLLRCTLPTDQLARLTDEGLLSYVVMTRQPLSTAPSG